MVAGCGEPPRWVSAWCGDTGCLGQEVERKGIVRRKENDVAVGRAWKVPSSAVFWATSAQMQFDWGIFKGPAWIKVEISRLKRSGL